MSTSAMFLKPSDAARRLGISVKALRLYEDRGLVDPVRTMTGWRTYGPEQMAQVAEIVNLRALGLSLAHIARILQGDSSALEQGLAAHETELERRAKDISIQLGKVRGQRRKLAHGHRPTFASIGPTDPLKAVFNLPWPWGGELFELHDIRGLNYIIGPLGSGKTRLAIAIAEALPRTSFIDCDRSADEARERMSGDAMLRSRVETALAWLVDDGATRTDALLALVAALETDGPAAMVADMVEKGLDQPTQEALAAYLRCQARSNRRPIFVLTRSSSILDLAEVAANETIIFCPANHSPPMYVSPCPGAAGYEAVSTCLGPPDVRARTEGVIAWRPEVA